MKQQQIKSDLFGTDYTETGVIPFFDKLVPFTTKRLFTGNPIPPNIYSTFLNNELQKLRNEDQTIENNCTIKTEHTRSSVKVFISTPDKLVSMSSSKNNWINWFAQEFEKFTLICSK